MTSLQILEEIGKDGGNLLDWNYGKIDASKKSNCVLLLSGMRVESSIRTIVPESSAFKRKESLNLFINYRFKKAINFRLKQANS